MWCCVMASMLAWAEPAPTDLAPPVRLLAGGQPINVDIGHAAPFVADLTGEGKAALLVGQFGGGKLRIYPNIASKTEPKFDKFAYLQAGGKEASVPSG